MKRLVLAAAVLAAACDTSDPKVIAENESQALSDIRVIVAAEETYSAANFGGYDELGCLVKPSSCMPGYPEAAPRFLDASLSSLSPRQGYARKFHPGPKAPADEPRRSPSALSAFAYTAVPEQPGRSGQRSFCSDASGVLCAFTDGSEPVVIAGRCPAPCTQP